MEGLLPWICDIIIMMMMIGEDLFIYLFTKGGKGREIGGIRKDWEVNEGMWFSFANEAEEEEGDEVVVVNALGAGVGRAGRFVLASVYFPLSLSIFSTLCLLSIGHQSAHPSKLLHKKTCFFLQSLSFFSKSSLHPYPTLGRQKGERERER